MKKLFDQVSENCSKVVTESYSTSFTLATKMLDSSIRQDIYNIYGFVRFADEIVDSFHDFDKQDLLNLFELDLKKSIKDKISLNPILNSFQKTFNKYEIDYKLVNSFLKSMKWDLNKKQYLNKEEFNEYVYGSADVVGLMCLKVFVKGNQKQYNELKPYAMSLGSAFQKVNFLRDLKADHDGLNRSYFPNLNIEKFDEESKKIILNEINKDFSHALKGIFLLPSSARFGVYTAYKYYLKLLNKLRNTNPLKIKSTRIRVPNYQKINVLARSYIRYRLNIL
ncbi:MAG: phytoene/squalene synthase family protein [Flavobacteriaceae bacterium]|jgi:phytoene/squalene synthetase|nr:phytoene/squalene synthase family protein [Flavobacteriaceae bacterium]MBT4298192.1 phytoene/squalene synthase family protein [Flavobacteriaceae bacterium]MBT4960376.1 phytoene/squalene synthase family protein [Flavobacteriaceae bacterium]MBT5232542.1 phytoene/squalene synthase family protein [Flavobacteriaceae bacterium]MBT5493699.1 phytoene/squalene synthase family protein [Flavobacteriaceae bacterium]|tara:strand:- start:5724 stop:6563 length:840 start_codon:yes stop_codon:yes gene_type:complete